MNWFRSSSHVQVIILKYAPFILYFLLKYCEQHCIFRKIIKEHAISGSRSRVSGDGWEGARGELTKARTQFRFIEILVDTQITRST